VAHAPNRWNLTGASRGSATRGPCCSRTPTTSQPVRGQHVAEGVPALHPDRAPTLTFGWRGALRGDLRARRRYRPPRVPSLPVGRERSVPLLTAIPSPSVIGALVVPPAPTPPGCRRISGGIARAETDDGPQLGVEGAADEGVVLRPQGGAGVQGDLPSLGRCFAHGQRSATVRWRGGASGQSGGFESVQQGMKLEVAGGEHNVGRHHPAEAGHPLVVPRPRRFINPEHPPVVATRR